MKKILSLYQHITLSIADTLSPWLLPHLARFCFAAALTGYYWVSAMTKFSDTPLGFLQPTISGYYQILPTVVEAANSDISAINPVWTAIVLLGSWAEVILPALIILGLFTRGAALGMIGFIIVQSLTDIFGHGVDAATIGTWFDKNPDALILDQRLFWVTILLVLVVRGAGKLSLDHFFGLEKSSE